MTLNELVSELNLMIAEDESGEMEVVVAILVEFEEGRGYWKTRPIESVSYGSGVVDIEVRE